MVRPTVARIDLAALQSNYKQIVAYLAREQGLDAVLPEGSEPGVRHQAPGIIAVVKANAYGHGAAQIALALEAAGADLLACADIEEGAALRAAGVRAGIPLLRRAHVSDSRWIVRLRPATDISTWCRAGGAGPQPSDTGGACSITSDRHRMNEGVQLRNLRRTLPALLASGTSPLGRLYALRDADDSESPRNRQRARFERAVSEVDDIQSELAGTQGRRSRRNRFCGCCGCCVPSSLCARRQQRRAAA